MKEFRSTIVIPKTEKVSYKRILGASREYKRSSISIKEKTDRLTITVTARDMASLRASINSVTRDVQVVNDSLKAGKSARNGQKV